MKRFIILAFVCALAGTVNAQVFNTSSTLKRGSFSAGFEPGVYAGGGSDFNLFLHGGIGITSGVDLGLKLGVLGGANYFGGDVEFALGKKFSVSAGAHSWGNFGLDGTALYTFDIAKGVDLFLGFDMDIDFPENDVQLGAWIPIGLEIGIKKNMAFIFESSICVTDYGAHWIGGGLNFYF
jgi:hypothetical protein